jgi:GT2 family glycosyltransferase
MANESRLGVTDVSSGGVLDDVSVVIPTLGRPILRRCLEALATGRTRPAEVIVVDQGRRAEIAALADEFSGRGLTVVYVPSDQTGRSAGLNTGIRRSRTRFIAVTDDDCVPSADWLACMTSRLRESGDCIVTGRVEGDEEGTVISVVTSSTPVIQRRPSLRFDRLSGGNMGLSRAVLERVGPFTEDPCMRTAEDGEFAYRALRAGHALVYVPEVSVRHLGWRDAAAREEQYRSYARSQGGFYGKYLRQGDLFMVPRILIHLLRSTRRWAVGALRGDAETAANGRAYVLGLLPGIAAGVKSRKPRG